jgi:MFS family permease
MPEELGIGTTLLVGDGRRRHCHPGVRPEHLCHIFRILLLTVLRSGDAGSDLLSTPAVLAVGFVARPFGGLFFGWMADQIGRRPAMTLSVVTAAAGSLIIGVSPTATTIGIGAPIVLLLARLIQGFAPGGELPAA